MSHVTVNNIELDILGSYSAAYVPLSSPPSGCTLPSLIGGALSLPTIDALPANDCRVVFSDPLVPIPHICIPCVPTISGGVTISGNCGGVTTTTPIAVTPTSYDADGHVCSYALAGAVNIDVPSVTGGITIRNCSSVSAGHTNALTVTTTTPITMQAVSVGGHVCSYNLVGDLTLCAPSFCPDGITFTPADITVAVSLGTHSGSATGSISATRTGTTCAYAFAPISLSVDMGTGGGGGGVTSDSSHAATGGCDNSSDPLHVTVGVADSFGVQAIGIGGTVPKTCFGCSGTNSDYYYASLDVQYLYATELRASSCCSVTFGNIGNCFQGFDIGDATTHTSYSTASHLSVTSSAGTVYVSPADAGADARFHAVSFMTSAGTFVDAKVLCTTPSPNSTTLASVIDPIIATKVAAMFASATMSGSCASDGTITITISGLA